LIANASTTEMQPATSPASTVPARTSGAASAVAAPAPAGRWDLPLLITAVLATVLLTLFLTWLVMLGPRDRDLAALAESGRRSEAGVARAEAAVTRIEREVARVRASIALVGATQLRDTVMSGEPYAVTLAALEGDLGAVPGAAPHVTALRASAAAGIPDLQLLADRFSTIATDALMLEVSGEDAGWFGRFTARFGAVTQYTSLRMGVDSGLSPSGEALRRIWTRFAAGELGQIDGSGLSPVATRTMQPWLTAVAERHAAVSAADRLLAAAAAAAK